MSSDLLERLGLRVPLFQSPMAGVSSPAMAAAVSAEGGLGALGVGAMTAAQAREAILATRALHRGPLNVNVFVHRPARADAVKERAWIARLAPEFERFDARPPVALHELYTSFLVDDAMLATLVELRPEVVSFHFGVPTDAQRDALRAAGIALIASATSLAEARAIEAAGLDAIVAQGFEAGGHRGVFDPDAPDDRLGTLALVRILVREASSSRTCAGVGFPDSRSFRNGCMGVSCGRWKQHRVGQRGRPLHEGLIRSTSRPMATPSAGPHDARSFRCLCRGVP